MKLEEEPARFRRCGRFDKPLIYTLKPQAPELGAFSFLQQSLAVDHNPPLLLWLVPDHITQAKTTEAATLIKLVQASLRDTEETYLNLQAINDLPTIKRPYGTSISCPVGTSEHCLALERRGARRYMLASRRDA